MPIRARISAAGRCSVRVRDSDPSRHMRLRRFRGRATGEKGLRFLAFISMESTGAFQGSTDCADRIQSRCAGIRTLDNATLVFSVERSRGMLPTSFVLVQPEMERWRFPLASIPPFGRRFSRDRCDHQAIPQHGCVPAEPASVSPGKIIVAPPRPSVSTSG
jgi:hypothetical protein